MRAHTPTLLERGSTLYVSLTSVVAATSGLLFGFDIAVINGAILFLRQQFGLSEVETEAAAGSLLAGCVFGASFGGWLSDTLVKRIGLRWGRRAVGGTGLALAASFLLATALTHGKLSAVVLLTLGYASMDCMLPVSWSVCLDVGRRYAGAVTGAMNMAGQVGSFLSSVAFGYLVNWFQSYNAPLFPMAAMMFVSAALFFTIDPTRQLVEEAAPAAARHVRDS